MANPKESLQKISTNEILSEADKQSIRDLITILNKSLEGSLLDEDEKNLVRDVIKKSKMGTIQPADIMNLCLRIFQIANILKDST